MGSATRQPRPRTYQEDFEAATRQIDEAIQQGLPNAAPDYDTVAVLMIHWSNDNIGVQPLEQALASPQKFLPLPSDTPTQDHIHLMISACGLEITLTPMHQGWIGSDAAALDNSGHEYLVAASMEAQASANLQASFTQRLLDILKRHAAGGISVSQIHALMVKTIRATGTTLHATPVHIGAPLKPSIVLKPITMGTREVLGLPRAATRGAGKVLVTLRLRGAGTVPDVEEFEMWLLASIPDQVESVAVESLFHGGSSTFVQLTLPMEVWTYLEGKPGFQFVEYVDNHNSWVRPERELGMGGLSLSENPRGLGNRPFPSSSKGRSR
ncbi:MAG: hypothetical protein Q9200_007602 [Gallowayella weberi]